jgi:hypothetical protein
MVSLKPRTLLFALIFGMSAYLARGQSEPSPSPSDTPPSAAELKATFDSLFTKWDVNQDGRLDGKELTAVIEDPDVHGIDAAIAVMLYRRIQKNETLKLQAEFSDYQSNPADKAKMRAQQAADEKAGESIGRDEALSLADQAPAEKKLFKNAKNIAAINHALFAPGDPNLDTFQQGGMGDCYLLAVVGAFVHRNPHALEKMILQDADGTYQVRFGTGEVATVAPLTDAELLMGAKEGSNHGVWLGVLEKAYRQVAAEQKEAKTGELFDFESDVPGDIMGRGGSPAVTIRVMTGHKTVNAPLFGWVKQDPEGGLDKADALLTKVMHEHRLMAMGTRSGVTLPKGIVHGHCLSVFGYDSDTRMVTVFNPWGNVVKPKGTPGLVNGYPTVHGVFQVPLSDFIKIFAGFCYETNTPAPVGG